MEVCVILKRIRKNTEKTCVTRREEGFKSMNIIIVGCGKIGVTILSSLTAEGHDVVAVDANAAVIEEIVNVYDVMGVSGNGVDYETLEEAQVSKAELFVAVTGSDELNMLSCFLAKKMGAKQTIARIRNPEYNDSSLSFVQQQLGLSMSINPELLAAQELSNLLKLPAAVKIETFSGQNFEMIELRIKQGSSLDGVKLKDLREKYRTKVLICAVQRGEHVYIPDGNFQLQSGDRIGLTASPEEIEKLLRTLGILQKRARNIMILGGSKTAYYLAKLLIEAGNTVKIIEEKEERCLELCTALPKATVIHGNGTQQELLMEEGILSQDAFVALTGIDEVNILISIFAASIQVPTVIAKVNRDELAAIAENLGLDSIISPKKTVADILVQYARALENSLGSSVETLYKLMDGKAEALEFNARGDARFLGIPLKNLKFKPNILIAGILRGRESIVPGGDDVILPGDKVVVLATNQRLQDLSDIIA